MPYSIRQRLVIFLLALTITSWSIIALISYLDARSEIETLFDAHLVQSAKVLLSLVDQELYEEKPTGGKTLPGNREEMELKDVEDHLMKHTYEKLLAFQISVNRDNFSFSSVGAPAQPLSENQAGFSDTTIGGINWRVFTLHDPANVIVIRVGEPYSVRSELIDEIAFNLLIPLLIGLPLISILIWKCVGLILDPLNKVASDIQQRNSSQLDPVSSYAVPNEVKPLINALNRLFYRLDKVIQGERRFTADAAHELRTPLAGLKTQAQIALKTSDPKKREHAINNILKSVDRMTHLVEQLLLLARLEPGVSGIHFENCNLTRITGGIVADLYPAATKKNIALNFHYDQVIQVTANPYAFSMLIRNLLDNAIRYTPAGGQVDVHVFEDTTGITVRIADNGPGIPWELRENVFKRFYRARNVHETGSGLGLSIVKQIADLHHAVIYLDESSKKGLQVDICLTQKTITDLDTNEVHYNSAMN